jgi:spermidine/putrescine transport system substrate-binding protein
MKLDPALASNELIFPSEAFLAKTQAFRALDGKEEQSFTKAFQQIKLGA